jgi:hypothetical protein
VQHSAFWRGLLGLELALAPVSTSELAPLLPPNYPQPPARPLGSPAIRAVYLHFAPFCPSRFAPSLPLSWLGVWSIKKELQRNTASSCDAAVVSARAGGECTHVSCGCTTCARQEAGFYLHGLSSSHMAVVWCFLPSLACCVWCYWHMDCRSLSTMQLLTKYLG